MAKDVNNPTPKWVEEMLEEARKHGHFYSDTDITCKTCARIKGCPYAWDLYNTGDDCLAMK